MARAWKKVPVVLQMEALECGAASLAMVLAYYKRYIPLEQLRADCGVSRDGSKASNILKAARYHGLQAKGYKYTAQKLQEIEQLPAIIHWNFNHFVVFDGFRKGKAVINDPASGVMEVAMEEFEQSFTGVVLLMEPGEEFEPYGKPRSAMQFLGKHMDRYKGAIGAIILCGFLIALLGAATPVFSKVFMDYVLLDGADEWMRYLLWAMMITLGTLFVLKLLMSYLLFRARQIIGMQMNTEFMWHTLRLPVEFFNQRSAGDISTRQQDNDLAAQTMLQKLAPIFIDVSMAVLYLFILLFLNVWMAMLAAAAAVLEIIAVKSSSAKNENESRNIARDEGKYVGAAMAGISMIETIKSSGAESEYFGKLSGYLAKYNNSASRLKVRVLVTECIPELLSGICNAMILIFGIYYILDGQFTIGMLLAFQGFVQEFMSPVGAVLGVQKEVQSVTSKLERIEDVLKYPVDVEIPFEEEQKEEYEKLSGQLEFQQVCFAYGKLAPLFIEDFNLKAEPGQMIAIVGGSGSGKSTLANLITGIYPLRSGRILFDGKERTEIDRYVFTRSVCIVNQNICLFNDTIRNNLTFWDSSIEEQTILDACKAAGIYDDIMMRAEGLDTMLSEGGKNFSGGQRQRMEIARALIQSPSLLILDEATSALDPPTEHRVMEMIQRRKITCIVIAHRLSTIRNADQIIMMEYGKEIERGTHESLLAAGGAYARLVQ